MYYISINKLNITIMIIAKQINQEVVDNGQYELFTTETVQDVDENEVTIPRSIGTYSLYQLEQEKANCLLAIAGIDEKISAINNLE